MEDKERSSGKGSGGDESGRYQGWEEHRRARREQHQRRQPEREQGRGERKERVLHTRVTEDLADDIRRVAEDLRLPVSNLVRNVLEDVFTVVESVADNVGDVVDDVMQEVERAGQSLRRRASRYSPETDPRDRMREDVGPKPPRPGRERPEFPDVVGWQPLILNAEQPCAGCERELRPGARAFVGLRSSGLSSTYLCRDCSRDIA
jgi:hypothetical protein